MKSGRPHNLFLSNKRNYTFLRLCIISVISDASDRGREGVGFSTTLCGRHKLMVPKLFFYIHSMKQETLEKSYGRFDFDKFILKPILPKPV